MPRASTLAVPLSLCACVLLIGDTARAQTTPEGHDRPPEAAPSSSQPDAQPEGHLFVVGGGHRGPELWARFIELAGGEGGARILVIPLASSEPEESGRSVADGYVERGAVEAISVMLTREQAEDPATAALLDEYTGIWFVGGSQSRITDVLAGTPFNEAIERRYREGAVVGGTSAGAAIMSDSMITGSQILAGEDTIGYHGDEFHRIERGYLEIVPGLGYLPGAIVDQHFVRRERHNRLISAVLERPSMIGLGIDESTAVVVRPDGTWNVVGESVAVVYDARDALITSEDAPVLGAGGVRFHVIPAGGSYNPATSEARLPARTTGTNPETSSNGWRYE